MTPVKNLTALAATALLSACASVPKGAPPFTPDTSGTADKATVYLYRSSGFAGSGLAPNIEANGVPLADLPAGGYFVYHAAPGEVEFFARTEAKTSVTIDAKAGETYYIKGTISMGAFVGHPHLVLVSNETGAREIKECKQVPTTVPTSEQVAAAHLSKAQ